MGCGDLVTVAKARLDTEFAREELIRLFASTHWRASSGLPCGLTDTHAIHEDLFAAVGPKLPSPAEVLPPAGGSSVDFPRNPGVQAGEVEGGSEAVGLLVFS